MDNQTLERTSAAVSLSDMEMFIFPELIYSLVLANLMSPRIWAWRDDPWFGDMDRMKPYRRIMRLKQYVMDHYAFNLDLDTWGLTTKERELDRFQAFIDPATLSRANALFGYEGDKYYFDIDIRRHFGLDKYEGNVIPYWKTETVEAMDAFRYRPGYETGAGECVSLSTLYAAALFLVARIPLRDLFLMATPLHSQNFVDVDDGILTNNRRLVTHTMWFNGTPLSAQARRALENEQVTIVAHESGCMHVVYPEATMDPDAYARFCKRLRGYLHASFSDELLGNFLRHARDIQKCFQFRWPRHGVEHYIGLDRVFDYEQGSPFRVNDATREKLMAEIESQEYAPRPLPNRIVVNDLETFIRERDIDLNVPADVERLKAQFASTCFKAEIAIERLVNFCRVVPRLPDAASKRFSTPEAPLQITDTMTREQLVERLESLRGRHPFAELAFHAYRDLNRVAPEPFLKAALERNPVSRKAAADLDTEACLARIRAMPDTSIYDGPGRLAQPDEVWNYGRGDGLEKALAAANILRGRPAAAPRELVIDGTRAILKTDGGDHAFTTGKQLAAQAWPLEGYAVPPLQG
jgi:hypothetical protein